jgi:hypothetical protein
MRQGDRNYDQRQHAAGREQDPAAPFLFGNVRARDVHP